MSKNLFLLSLATITLAATTLTNVASSRADSVAVVDGSSSPLVGCAAVVPAPPGCSSSSTPSPTAPVHTTPYPSYLSPIGYVHIPQYPHSPMSETPGRVMCLVAPCPGDIK